MSSRHAGALQTVPSDVHPSDVHPSDARNGRIQRKWTILLLRAHARESALRSALAYARAEEAQLRLQLDGERQRHAIESNLLRDRLRRIEQSFLSYVAAARGALSAPRVARLRNSGGSLDAGASPRAGGLLALAPGDTSTALVPGGSSTVLAQGGASGSATGAPPQTAPAPFDPIATVASMLPLSRAHAGAPEADIDGALDRLQAVVRSTVPHRLDTDLPPAPLPAAPGAAAPTVQVPAVQTPDDEHRSGQDAHRDGQDKQRSGHDERSTTDDSGASDTPWFPRAFRRLAEEDPEAAGRLFLQLLPAQGLVWPEDVAYRIEVAETGALAVNVRAGRGTVRALLESGAPARAGEPTLRTDLAGLARTVAGRRGWSRVGARLASARNRHLRPLRALAAAPLELRDLRRAGARPDPVLLLRLLALAIDPEWTAEEVFTVACRWHGRVQSDCYVHVFERAPVAVTSAPPLGRVAATLSCDPADMLDILLGEIPLEHPRAQIGGDRAAIASLLEWFRRVDATAITIPAEPAGVA
jgi:hypothetical protein